MRIDRKKQEELAQRQGNTKKTVLQLGWFIICIGIGYFIAGLLLDPTNGIVSVNELYSAGISRNIDPLMIQFGFGFIIGIIMQFFTLIGFFIGSPHGRAKTGRPTAEATFEKNKPLNPYEDR